MASLSAMVNTVYRDVPLENHELTESPGSLMIKKIKRENYRNYDIDKFINSITKNSSKDDQPSLSMPSERL